MVCLLKTTMFPKQDLGLVRNNTRAYVKLGEMLPAWMRGIIELSTGKEGERLTHLTIFFNTNMIRRNRRT